MTKKIKSTSDRFVESLRPRERKKFFEEYQELLLSELLLATMEKDEISVRKLAKLAKVSPTIVQAMGSGTKKDFSMTSFFKILRGLGCKRFIVELKGQFIPLDISRSTRK